MMSVVNGKKRISPVAILTQPYHVMATTKEALVREGNLVFAGRRILTNHIGLYQDLHHDFMTKEHPSFHQRQVFKR